ncbi:MAG: helix-turn-helix transcriptional regulator [Lachnospiraceae bacterium]|nr:helix-turn-helix transcriptional regulator [Lachnospiraceae bacterium]
MRRKEDHIMSLGQNLQFLRKRDNITQEQLAETLEVSRQSVSKWESDTSYPEMDKLLQLANLFHCNLDDLVQKDVSTQYVEDKCNYDQFMNQFSKRITLGVGLILSGMTLPLLLMIFFHEIQGLDMEEFSGVIFLLFVVVAVAIFIVSGSQRSYFEKKNPYIENFYSEEEKEAFHKKFTTFITTGVVLIIFGMILAAASDIVIPGDHMIRDAIDLDIFIGAQFMLFVTIAVILFVYAGTQKSKYNINHYNLMHDHNSQIYKNSKKNSLISGCIMMVATIIYLTCGFIWDLWKIAWVVYPIFGIACGIVSTIINRNNEEEN